MMDGLEYTVTQLALVLVLVLVTAQLSKFCKPVFGLTSSIGSSSAATARAGPGPGPEGNLTSLDSRPGSWRGGGTSLRGMSRGV
jgi:hypothetical protein